MSDFSKEKVDKLLSHDDSKSDAPVVQTSVVQISSPPVHQPVETGTSPVMQLPITTVENKVHNTTSTSNLTTVPATSYTTTTPVACYKLPSNPDQISTPAKQNSPWRGWTVLYQALLNPEQISTPATQNSPWRGSTAPNQVPSDLKQISTLVSQTSPWRGWTVPNQAVSPRPSLPGTSLQPHPRWGLKRDFPPPDAWIDQLHEYGVTSREIHC